MQPAANGPDRNFQHLGNFLIAQPVEILQNHDGALIFVKRIQRALNQRLFLGTLHRQARVAVGDRTDHAAAVRRRKRHASRLVPAAFAERQIHRNPIQPRVKRALKVKLVELLIGSQEGILQQIHRVVRRPDQPQQRGIEPPLMPAHENPVGLVIAGHARAHQVMIVVDCDHYRLRRPTTQPSSAFLAILRRP